MDLGGTKAQVEDFLRKAGEEALKAWRDKDMQIHYKTNADFTTQIDEKIERDFSDFVTSNFPDHGFKGEEDKNLNRSGEYNWLIDPIDGTKFFANQVPLWGLTVALKHGEETVLGMIYNPVTDQMYSAINGQGAFLNGNKLEILQETKLDKIQISIDIPVDPAYYAERKAKITPIVEKLNTTVFRVRNIGSGAFSLAWLSQGFFGAYVDLYRPESKLVDIEGGLLIAQEAGAKVDNRMIKDDPEMARTVVASEQVLEQILPILEEL